MSDIKDLIKAEEFRNRANAHMAFVSAHVVDAGEIEDEAVKMRSLVAKVQKKAFDLYAQAAKLGCCQSKKVLASRGVVVEVAPPKEPIADLQGNK